MDDFSVCCESRFKHSKQFRSLPLNDCYNKASLFDSLSSVYKTMLLILLF